MTIRFKSLSALIALALVLMACGQKKEGVGEFLGLKFGIALDHPIKEGPRDPPIFNGDLQQFYEISFPNQEFNFVGVATIKNNPIDEKSGVIYSKEGAIWGAFFLQNKTNCTRVEYDKLKTYITKNYGATLVQEDISATPRSSGGTFHQMYATLLSPYASWSISCTSGEFGNRTLVIRDYNVLKKYANEKGKELLAKAMREAQEIQKRKLD